MRVRGHAQPTGRVDLVQAPVDKTVSYMVSWQLNGHGEWTVGMDCSGRTVGDREAVAADGSGATTRGRGREHR